MHALPSLAQLRCPPRCDDLASSFGLLLVELLRISLAFVRLQPLRIKVLQLLALLQFLPESPLDEDSRSKLKSLGLSFVRLTDLVGHSLLRELHHQEGHPALSGPAHSLDLGGSHALGKVAELGVWGGVDLVDLLHVELVERCEVVVRDCTA